jgi:hypothetical protein
MEKKIGRGPYRDELLAAREEITDPIIERTAVLMALEDAYIWVSQD